MNSPRFTPAVLMVAAENGHLPGGKVGGIGDVIRELPHALVAEGCRVQLVTPGYGTLSGTPGMVRVRDVTTRFAGRETTGSLFCVEKNTVRHWVVEHPAITHERPGKIYYEDGSDNPYGTDATRFALFCSLVATLLVEEAFGALDVVHLHDWHAAPLLLLKEYGATRLPDMRYVFSIHNLAHQGVRPFRDNDSSLANWFPEIGIDARVSDPRWPDCVNLMRAGIVLADQLHVVSANYANEILRHDDPEHATHGGEGLEADLRKAASERRLTGILNGCEYPEKVPGRKLSLGKLIDLCEAAVLEWAAEEHTVRSAHMVALARLKSLRARTRQTLVTSVGRQTEQKVGLLRYPHRDGQSVLHELLDTMGTDGCLFMLGAGDEEIERFMTATSARFENFVFLRGFSETLADTLYRSGRLFLMPSLFEPCGISQMMAMRAGQPCIANLVGGLKDTIEHGVTGYGFAGHSRATLAAELAGTFRGAFADARARTSSYARIAKAAAARRFRWQDAARRYIRELYR